MKYIKFGFARATDDASHEVRDGHISRDEAISLVKRYDGEFPEKYFQDFLDYLDITSGEFWDTVNSWRPPHLWIKDQNKWKLKKTAGIAMFFGTLVVLVFSDPMVDVLAALGNFVGIKPFYVSFVLAPLASNASELVASMNYASKKTKSTITTSLSTLLGAANMNNTFCLAIFYALIVCRTGLKWTFSAETIVIVGVQVIMFFFAYQSTMKLWTAWVVLSFFPLSILLVAWLESASVGML